MVNSKCIAAMETSDNESWEDLSDDENLEEEKMYDLKPWPNDKQEKTGYVFKGKHKKFVKSVENLKSKLKKGFSRVINTIDIKVVDSKKIPHGIEKDVMMTKDGECGKAKLKIYEQNPKKKHITMVVNKSKDSDEKFVEFLTQEVVKTLVDSFISGEGWLRLFGNSPGPLNSSDRFQCNICLKCLHQTRH